MEFVYPYALPEGSHPYAGLLVHPLGLRLEPDLINDLCYFLFDMLGCKFFDVEPTTVEYSLTWDDDHELDVMVPGGDKAAVWCPNLPPGLSLDPRTGRMVGTVEPGVWEWTVHVGPQVKYDARGGDGSPYSEGQWVGALEERFTPPAPTEVDVQSMTAEEKEALLVQLLAEKQHSDENEAG